MKEVLQPNNLYVGLNKVFIFDKGVTLILIMTIDRTSWCTQGNRYEAAGLFTLYVWTEVVGTLYLAILTMKMMQSYD